MAATAVVYLNYWCVYGAAHTRARPVPEAQQGRPGTGAKYNYVSQPTLLMWHACVADELVCSGFLLKILYRCEFSHTDSICVCAATDHWKKQIVCAKLIVQKLVIILSVVGLDVRIPAMHRHYWVIAMHINRMWYQTILFRPSQNPRLSNTFQHTAFCPYSKSKVQ